MAIRNDQIFELLQKVLDLTREMKTRLTKIEGRLGTLETIVSKLPCKAHSNDLILLKHKVGSHKLNWNRVVNLMLAAGQAILILWLAAKVGV